MLSFIAENPNLVLTILSGIATFLSFLWGVYERWSKGQVQHIATDVSNMLTAVAGPLEALHLASRKLDPEGQESERTRTLAEAKRLVHQVMVRATDRAELMDAQIQSIAREVAHVIGRGEPATPDVIANAIAASEEYRRRLLEGRADIPVRSRIVGATISRNGGA